MGIEEEGRIDDPDKAEAMASAENDIRMEARECREVVTALREIIEKTSSERIKRVLGHIVYDFDIDARIKDATADAEGRTEGRVYDQVKSGVDKEEAVMNALVESYHDRPGKWTVHTDDELGEDK